MSDSRRFGVNLKFKLEKNSYFEINNKKIYVDCQKYWTNFKFHCVGERGEVMLKDNQEQRIKRIFYWDEGRKINDFMT